MARTLRDVGEFGFIGGLRRKTRNDRTVLIGIGDDAALVKGSRKNILITTDMIIEGRHFLKKKASPYDIGWKAMAVNLSDIAAMGGTPTHAVIAAGLPAHLPLTYIDELYRGIRAAAMRFGVNIVGGDTNRSNIIVLSVTLLGEAGPRTITRSGAKVGDWIFVTGPLGGSYVSGKHLCFVPRLDASRFLAENYRVRSMMDLSDGLASDLKRLSEASRVGAVIDAASVPLARGAKGLAAALGDGEDFELLFTVSPADGKKLLKDRRAKGFTRIGVVTAASEGLRLLKNGRRTPFPRKGFDHFR